MWTFVFPIKKEEDNALKRKNAEFDLDYDEILMKEIDENMLRRIFSGLCAK